MDESVYKCCAIDCLDSMSLSSVLKLTAFYNRKLSSDVPVTETETHTEMIGFSKTDTKTKTGKNLKTDTLI